MTEELGNDCDADDADDEDGGDDGDASLTMMMIVLIMGVRNSKGPTPNHTPILRGSQGPTPTPTQATSLLCYWWPRFLPPGRGGTPPGRDPGGWVTPPIL